jgi:hypothetical protein
MFYVLWPLTHGPRPTGVADFFWGGRLVFCIEYRYNIDIKYKIMSYEQSTKSKELVSCDKNIMHYAVGSNELPARRSRTGCDNCTRGVPIAAAAAAAGQ